MDFGDTEQVILCLDRATGMRAVIALDDTTRGPGLGGVRWMSYPDDEAAVTEARRLARVMTLKNACADLPYGGAKSVIVRQGPVPDRGAVMRAFGRFVDRLGGAYVAAVDMGTTVEDLAEMGRQTSAVSCDRHDPSPWTALGVFAGIRAAVRRVLGQDVEGTRVLVQGAGHVGADLVRRLAGAGAEVIVADVDGARAAAVAEETGSRVVDPATAVRLPCDVLAPCAVARVVTPETVPALACRIVAGGANDVLAGRECADLLARRDVAYVPDFVVNSGGVIHIHALRSGWEPPKLEESILAIGDTVADVLDRAARTGRTSLEVAESMASERIGRPVGLPA
jgi:leucine dehydrogenase